MATELQLKPSESDSTPRAKLPPNPSAIPVPFIYNPSDDGTDENLLIILHGLGDTHAPFAKLGRQLKLPQTATLALRAPQQIPYLYEDAFQWYPSFDALGELVARPNPAPALALLASVLTHLTADCAWPPQKIHLFGFAQGGSVVAEVCLAWWRAQSGKTAAQLGSVVTVGGRLLSHPTLPAICPTALLVFHRMPPSELELSSGDFSSLRKGFSFVKEVKLAGEGMPKAKDEWQPIMEFWSQRLSRRQVDGLYEVMGGLSR